MARRILLDTDIGTDVDDALALAFALRHPEIELAAVTTVSGNTRRRAQIAAKLIALNGGPQFTFTPAISLVVNCDTQEEVDYYWNALSADPSADSSAGAAAIPWTAPSRRDWWNRWRTHSAKMSASF